MKKCPICGKEVKWYQGFSDTWNKQGRYCSFACFKGRTVKDLGREFKNNDDKLRYIFINEESLVQENKRKQSSAIGWGLFLGFVLGLIFGTSLSSWILFFILLAAPPIGFYYLKERTIKEIISAAQEYRDFLVKQEIKERDFLIKLEKEIKKDLLDQFNKRYFDSKQKMEHISELVNLINHKKKLNLSDQNVMFLLIQSEKEHNIGLFCKGLSQLKDKSTQNLSKVLIKLFPNVLEDEENYDNLFNQFIEYLQKEKIECDQEQLKQELIKEYKIIQAKNFEEKLKRSADNKLSVEEIEHLDGFEFEELIGDLFRKAGYKVRVTKKSGDQGADIIVEKDGISTAIQTKKYNGSVGNKAVQEIVASVKYYDCDKAMVITTGDFTKSAYELAAINRVKLIDGKELDKLFDEIL